MNTPPETPKQPMNHTISYKPNVSATATIFMHESIETELNQATDRLPAIRSSITHDATINLIEITDTLLKLGIIERKREAQIGKLIQDIKLLEAQRSSIQLTYEAYLHELRNATRPIPAVVPTDIPSPPPPPEPQSVSACFGEPEKREPRGFIEKLFGGLR